MNASDQLLAAVTRMTTSEQISAFVEGFVIGQRFPVVASPKTPEPPIQRTYSKYGHAPGLAPTIFKVLREHGSLTAHDLTNKLSDYYPELPSHVLKNRIGARLWLWEKEGKVRGIRGNGQFVRFQLAA